MNGRTLLWQLYLRPDEKGCEITIGKTTQQIIINIRETYLFCVLHYKHYENAEYGTQISKDSVRLMFSVPFPIYSKVGLLRW